MTIDARYVLFLNPDTEIRSGTFAELVRTLDQQSEVGLAGVVQLDSDGQIYPTIRRFPNALRALGRCVRSRAAASPAQVAARTRARRGALRPRDGLRLDIGLVHVRAA